MNHALLSPSKAARWLTCTPSVRFAEQFPEPPASASAEEGTFAHKYAEMEIKHFYNLISEKEYTDFCNEAKSNKYMSVDLVDYVQMYTDTVISTYEEARQEDKFAQMFIEAKLDFSPWVTGGYGIGDTVIIANNELIVIDLKYGKNIAVQATNNPQLRLYALGAYNVNSFFYDISSITTMIVQPRNGGISTENLSLKELLDWGESIKPLAQLAYKGGGELRAGSHCRFCPCAPRCKELARHNMELAKYDFKAAEMLSDAELADILSKVEGLVNYANKIKEYCLEEALKGHKFAGYKLVEGRSVAKYDDVEAIENTLIENGYEPEKIYKPRELLGTTAMKKVLSTKKFVELVAPYMIKPQGKPVLVPENDKRQELNSAKNDFDVI